jgi:hypothetical protein
MLSLRGLKGEKYGHGTNRKAEVNDRGNLRCAFFDGCGGLILLNFAFSYAVAKSAADVLSVAVPAWVSR